LGRRTVGELEVGVECRWCGSTKKQKLVRGPIWFKTGEGGVGGVQKKGGVWQTGSRASAELRAGKEGGGTMVPFLVKGEKVVGGEVGKET